MLIYFPRPLNHLTPKHVVSYPLPKHPELFSSHRSFPDLKSSPLESRLWVIYHPTGYPVDFVLPTDYAKAPAPGHT